MAAVAAVLLAFGSIGLVAAVLTIWSTHRRAALQDVDGPSPAVIAALLARGPAPKPERLRCRTGDLAAAVRCNAMPDAVDMLVAMKRVRCRRTAKMHAVWTAWTSATWPTEEGRANTVCESLATLESLRRNYRGLAVPSVSATRPNRT